MQGPEPIDLTFYLPRSLRRNLSDAWREIEELWENFPCKNPSLRAERSKAGTIRLLQRCVGVKKQVKRLTHQLNGIFLAQVYGGTKNLAPMLKAVTQVLADHGVISLTKTGRVTYVSIAEAEDDLVATTVLHPSNDLKNEILKRRSVQRKQLQDRDYDAWIRVDPDPEYDADKQRIERSLVDRTYMNVAAAAERGELRNMNSTVSRGNNRYHSFWTSLSKPARACAYDIRTGDRVVGIDAVNAQPALIGYWISEYIRFQWSKPWYTGPEREIINDPRWNSQFTDFRNSCYRGIYDALTNESGLERYQVKGQLLWLMFRNPRFQPRDSVKSAVLDAFKRRWPLINEVIEINNRRMALKHNTGDCLSWHGRALESKMMNSIVAALKRHWLEDKSIGWFIVHDCLFVTRQHCSTALKLARPVGRKYGVRFTLSS